MGSPNLLWKKLHLCASVSPSVKWAHGCCFCRQSALTCIPAKCWMKGRSSKPERDRASPKLLSNPLGSASICRQQMWTGMALGMGCLGPRVCFTITALSVRLLQHLPGAMRPFSPVETPSLSTEQDTGLEGGDRGQKAARRVKAKHNCNVCVTVAVSVYAFSYYSSQLSRIYQSQQFSTEIPILAETLLWIPLFVQFPKKIHYCKDFPTCRRSPTLQRLCFSISISTRCMCNTERNSQK